MMLKPVISEKTIALADKENTYVFYVPKSVNKLQVTDEIKNRFDVNVTRVRTVVLKGKRKRMPVRGGRKTTPGKRSDMKKAYVTLGDGDSITLFEGSE